MLRLLSSHQFSKDAITQLYLQIGRSLSCCKEEDMENFIELLSVGRGFPLYAAIVHAVKKFDPDSK